MRLEAEDDHHLPVGLSLLLHHDANEVIRVTCPSRYERAWRRIFGGMCILHVREYIGLLMVARVYWTPDGLFNLRMQLGCGCDEYDPDTTAVTDHHMRPKSRGGGRGANIVGLPRRTHADWHELFDLLTPAEAQRCIERVLVHEREWTISSLRELRSRILLRTP